MVSKFKSMFYTKVMNIYTKLIVDIGVYGKGHQNIDGMMLELASRT